MKIFTASTKALSIFAVGAVLASGFSGTAAAQAVEPAVDAQVAPSASSSIDMIVDFNVQGVTLGDGRAGLPSGDPTQRKNSVVSIDSPDGTGDFPASIRFLDRNLTGKGSALYQIYALGAPTGYWVSTEVSIPTRSPATAPRLQCAIVQPDVDGDGFTVVDAAPYKCSVEKKREDRAGNVWLTTSVSLNRWVASSGTVTVPESSPVSLTNGVFHQDSAYSSPGTAAITAGERAPFSTVALATEQPKHEEFRDQARTEFAYEILLDGQPTGYWVGGLSTNHRGSVIFGRVIFSADGHCGIYDSNPLAHEDSKLDDATPSSLTGYMCSAEGGFVNEGTAAGNIHYDANFTVSTLWG